MTANHTPDDAKDDEWVAPVRPPPYPIEDAIERAMLTPVGRGEDTMDWPDGDQDRNGHQPGHRSHLLPQPGGTQATGYEVTRSGTGQPGSGASHGAQGAPEGPRASAPETPTAPEETIESLWLRTLPKRWMANYCMFLSAHGNEPEAARTAGVNSPLVRQWAACCQGFREAIEDAKLIATAAVKTAVRISATVGDLVPVVQRGLVVHWVRKKSVPAAALLLAAEDPAHFGPQAGLLAAQGPGAAAGGPLDAAGVGAAVRGVLGTILGIMGQATTGPRPAEKVVEGEVVPPVPPGSATGQPGGA